MSRFYDRLIIVSIITAIYSAAAVEVEAVSVQTFNSTTSLAQASSILTALSNEVYRDLRVGHVAQAACISDRFSTKGSSNEAFDAIVGDTVVTRNPESDTIESIILDEIADRCDGTYDGDPSAALTKTRLTPVNEFFANVGIQKDQVITLSVALGTQALRAKREGHNDYSQCIMTNFVLPKDTDHAADGFSVLFNQLYSHSTSTVPLEQILTAAVLHYCGEEPR